MSIDDLLKLQQDLKKINEYDKVLEDRNDIDLFKENIEYFEEIGYDIQNKLEELLPSDDND
jgi:hypothetical protein